MNIDFTELLVGFLILVVSLSVHEAAHAWTANLLGDSTARLLGRVTLNPAVHVDPLGTIVLPLVAMATHAPLLGWAKPVPVNTHQLGRHWKRKFMAIAAAGPISNLILAALAAAVLKALVSPGEQASESAIVAYNAMRLNIVLAIFNMVPVPPLDGGNVLSGLLHGRAADFYDRLRPYGFLIIYALLLSGALFAVVNPLEQVITAILL